MVNQKKNILFIQCDSMDGRVMGCMGHGAAYTPNLDKLAASGALFHNAYSNSPICCPSRASMRSGQYIHHCEAWNNYKGLSEKDPTFVSQLNTYNITTPSYGKLDYLCGGHTIRNGVAAWTRSVNIHRPVHKERKPVIFDDNRERVHAEFWAEAVDPCKEWLVQQSQDNRPFVLYTGIRSPHPAFKTSKKWLSLIDENKVTLPPEDMYIHPVMEQMKIQKNWTHGFTPEFVKTVRHIYYAMIAETDAMVGEIIDTLERLGLRDSTYIIFTSDHGEMNMEHQQFYKMSMYESSVRVPMIIAGPDIPAGTIVNNLVSLVDLYPTIMDMTETPKPSGIDGYSLMPLMRGGIHERPDWVLSEFHGFTCNTGTFMLRYGDWKYIAYVGYEPMLFNLSTDPHEINNIAEIHPDIVQMMDSKLRNILDYDAVDAKVKQHDKQCFSAWRAETLNNGTYRTLMSRIFSGWEDVNEKEYIPWNDLDEEKISKWLVAV